MLERNPQLRAVANSRPAETTQEGARIFDAGRGSDPDAFGPRMVAAAMAFLVGGISALPGGRLS
ncbi:hypothetical protein WB401_09880 [Streptomyces brasiliscabiei]|uniref:Uncharacterized protein n=1 Tax=Streptomyces brasiliscabiei TaxID=2736302 RepID=A0ABU8GIV8_9ACTN